MFGSYISIAHSHKDYVKAFKMLMSPHKMYGNVSMPQRNQYTMINATTKCPLSESQDIALCKKIAVGNLYSSIKRILFKIHNLGKISLQIDS